MKTFKEYIKEEMLPFAQTEKGFVGVDNGPVRDNINLILANVTARSYSTPYHAMEIVRKALAPFSIFVPATNFLDGDAGHEVFEINQFGDKMGFDSSGTIVTKKSSPYFVYFEYAMTMSGAFDIFCEIVDQDELDEILDDIESELGDDVTSGDEKDAEDSFDVYKADNQKLDEEVKKPTGGLKKACWKGYTAVGMKKKNGRSVPNCVPVSEEQVDEETMSRVDAEKLARKHANASAQAKKEGKHSLSYDHGEHSNKIYDILLKHYDSEKIPASKLLAKSKKIFGESVEQINEVGDTKKGREFMAKVASKHYTKNAYKSPTKETEKKLKKVDKVWAKHDAQDDKATGKKTVRVGGPLHDYNEETQLNEISKKKLGDYIKKASHDVAARSAATRGFARDADAQRKDKKPMDARKSDERADKMFKKSWNRRAFMAKAVDKLTKEEASADTHTGALTKNGKPVMSPTATKASAEPEFKMPKKVPLPPTRDKNMASDSDIENIKKDLVKESNPAKEGMIAAGYKGSNPAEQGAIAVKRDDERRDRKANFKVAKKLARQAMKKVKNKK